MNGISSSFYFSLLWCWRDNRPEMPKHAAKSLRTLNKSYTHIVQTVLVHNLDYAETKSSERCTSMPKFIFLNRTHPAVLYQYKTIIVPL
jgi:hypothetical protein